MIKLNNGAEMPIMGFGCYLIDDANSFVTALKNGYRHFDIASFYDNEELLGEGLAKGMQECGLKREDLFIVTKMWHTEYDDPEAAVRRSLKKLQMDYIDIYLIHWPYNGIGPIKKPMHVLWREMEALVKKGLTRGIGLSNFNI